MSWKRITLAATAAAGLALAISQPLDDQPRLSIRLWIALTAAGIAALLVVQVLSHLPVDRGPAWFSAIRRWWVRRRRIEPSGTAFELRAAAGLVARSTENVRTHNNQLRPRLLELADHAVPRRTVDPDDRLQELIDAAGDTGWLIDPTIDDRAPTLADIDRFLDRVLDAGVPKPTHSSPVTT